MMDQVSVPTLVLHADRDKIAPLKQGQELAASIPGAKYVQMDSSNHILLEHEPAWQRFCDVVLEFTGIQQGTDIEVLKGLTDLEREILGKLSIRK